MRFCAARRTRFKKWDISGAAHLPELHDQIFGGVAAGSGSSWAVCLCRYAQQLQRLCRSSMRIPLQLVSCAEIRLGSYRNIGKVRFNVDSGLRQVLRKTKAECLDLPPKRRCLTILSPLL